MKPTFYLDLDRTIFHTENIADIFASLAQLYPENEYLKGAYEQRHEYFVTSDLSDASYYYDFVQHLCDVELDCDVAFSRLVKQLGDGRFEYEGAEELVRVASERGDVKVLTYGEDRYQRFKASLCPSLANVEIITIIESKVEYLNTHARVGDWMIDDREMPGVKPGVTVLRIQHDKTIPADVHSLFEAAQCITGKRSAPKHK